MNLPSELKSIDVITYLKGFKNFCLLAWDWKEKGYARVTLKRINGQWYVEAKM